MCKLACRMIVLLLLLSVIALGEPIQVTIDILPGESPNTVDIGSRGSLPVAILTTDDFKVASIDYTTLQLSGVGVCLAGKHQTPVCTRADVDGDHDKDLIAEFPLESFSSVDGEFTLALTGRTKKGLEFTGSDMLICTSVSPSSVAAAMAGRSPDVSPALCDGGILFCWDDFVVSPPATIVEYLIYRTEDQCSYGENAVACLTPWQAEFEIPVLCVDPINAPQYTGPAGSFAHSVIDDELQRMVWGYLCFPAPCGVVVAGVAAGKDYNCRVSCRYSLPLESGEVIYRESRSVYAGHATYLTRPLPVSPGSSAVVDLSNVTFEWQGSAMAFRYSIEVSTTPSFERTSTWVSVIREITATDGEPVLRTFTDVLNNAPELAGVPPGTTLFWRVGAKNKWDNPGAYPAGPSPLAEGGKNTRYIYNSAENVLSFTVGDSGGGPPPPPPL